MTHDYEEIRKRIEAARSQPDQQPEREEPEPEETLTDIGARMFNSSTGDDSLHDTAARMFRH